MASHDSYDSYRPSSTSPPRHSHSHSHNSHHSHHHSHHSNHNTHNPRPAPPPPLTAAAKSTITTLKTTYKKRGHFDALRKDIYQNFADSEAGNSFKLRIEQTTTTEIERDPTLLVRDKSSAAELLEGLVGWAEAEREVDRVLAERRCEIEERVRGIMRECGVEELVAPEPVQQQEVKMEVQKIEVQRPQEIVQRPQEIVQRPQEMVQEEDQQQQQQQLEGEEEDMEVDLVDLVPVRDATPPPQQPPQQKRERVSRFDDPIGLHRRKVVAENGAVG